jgi:hypothetical protein
MFFDANPEEVPLRRKVLRSLLFAGMKAGTFAILAPVFQGKTCSALPSARAYLIVFAVIQLPSSRRRVDGVEDDAMHAP